MELNLQQNSMNKKKKEKICDKKVKRFNLKQRINVLENKFESFLNLVNSINERI